MELKYINKQKHQRNRVVFPHVHSCHELIYCYYGKATVYYSDDLMAVDNQIALQTKYVIERKTDKSIEFKESMLAIFPRGMIHNETYLADETKIFSVGFVTDTPVDFTIFTDVDEEFKKIFSKIQLEFNNKRPYYLDNINSYLSICLNNLRRTCDREKKSRETYSFFHILNYLDEYFNSNVDLDTMANMSGYSKDYFRYLFKNKTGSSFHSYVIKKRLECAEKLIINTDKSLTEIAEFCGYENYYQFNAIFKKYYGLSPSFYRKSKSTVIASAQNQVE